MNPMSLRPGRWTRVDRPADPEPMPTRTYRAATMKDALAKVRRDLGGSAVILGSREVQRRRLFGLGRRDLIEVTAADPAAAPAVAGRVVGSAAPPGGLPLAQSPLLSPDRP